MTTIARGNTVNKDTDLILVDDIAAILGISREWCLRKYTKRPDFPKPAIRLSSKVVRWRKSDVDAWLKKTAERY